MKTKIKIVSTLLCALLVFTWFFLAACGGSALTVTFDYNYEGAPQPIVREVESGARVTPPADPSRDGYEFTGWYTDKAATDDADFGYGITQSQTFYAGWDQTSVMVTFDPNYDGSTAASVSVGIGESVSQPADPVRGENYLFTGWYTDKECTTAYDFTATVSYAITLYAGWEEVSADDTVTIMYYYNYDASPDDGVYYSTRIKTGRRPSAPAAPVRDGYYFADWYSDSACTIKFDFQQSINENTSVYAKWLTVFTFEAEYTDVTGKEGNGYSSSASGTDLIINDIGGTVGQQTGQAGASNGFYVASLYEPNVSIDFNINSDREVSDAVLILRLSVEYYDMTFSPDNFTIRVNGKDLVYSDIELNGAVNVADENEFGKRPFTNHEITLSLPLVEGNNTINLIVSNNTDLGGTMYAEAPMIDCIYICTDAVLSWMPEEDNLIGKI